MKIFLHVLYTWLLANVIHPFVFVIAEMIMYGNNDIDPFIFFLIFFISILFSIPALLIVWLGSIEILKTNYSGLEKLFLWYLLAITVTFVDFVLIISCIFRENLSFNDLGIVLPALVATFLSISIRYKYFLQLNNIFNSNKLIHK
jgi:hypothetical protein